MLILVGLGLIFGAILKKEVDASTITVNPPPPILYYTVGRPAAITCIVTLDAATAGQQVGLFSLGYSPKPTDVVKCFIFTGPSGSATLQPSDWAGVANCTWSSPQSNSVQDTFYLTSIQDGSYSCTASFQTYPDLKQSFQVFTTKQPDRLYISLDGVQSVATNIELNDGVNATLTCTVINSKPGYSLSWNTVIGITGMSATVNDSSSGISNSSISVVVVGSSSIHGTQLTCTGVPSISAPGLDSKSTTVNIAVIYGPSNNSSSIVQSLPSASVTCPLSSYPAIASYVWTQNGAPSNCSAQTCLISVTGPATLTQLTCQGSNPRSSLSATGIITITWTAATTLAPMTATGSSLSLPAPTVTLGAGPIAGIVIGAVAFVVIITIITVVCVKRKQIKGNSESAATRRSNTSATPAQQSSRPYNFDNASAMHGAVVSSGGYKSPMSAQPDLVRNSVFSPSAPDPEQQQKAPATPPPAYPGAIDQIDQKPRSRKPIALYDTAFDDAYPNQSNASYIPSPKY